MIAIFQANDFYPDTDSYLAALAEAMKPEYEAIVDAGLILQIDCPDLAMGRHVVYSADDEATFLARAAMQVEVLNAALENVPAERARLHVCWGNYEGPHHRDIPLAAIADLLLSAKPRGLLFEAANPRHAHEWTVFRDRRGWDDKILIPGVIDSTTNYVEHPDLVAERIGRFVGLAGAERVIAGHRLRLRHLRRHRQGRPGHRPAEARRPGRGRGDREPPAQPLIAAAWTNFARFANLPPAMTKRHDAHVRESA